MSKHTTITKLAPLLLLTLGCLLPTAPWTPSEPSTAVTPPPWVEAQWDSVLACAGLSGTFKRLHFRVVADVDGDGAFACPAYKVGCMGVYDGERTLYFSPLGWSTPSVVRHELLHAGLKREGHPTPPFGICAILQV